MAQPLLKFGIGNSKLDKSIGTFSLPAGHSCPFAKECLSKANKLTGKIIDGEHCRFRCFAASDEALYPAVRNMRWHNFELTKEINSVQSLANRIHFSLPKTPIIRIHVSGDFYSERYFLAWINVAYANPNTIFYAYTKALPFWIKYKDRIPANLRLTASMGGTHDHLIAEHNLKFAVVVLYPQQALDRGLEIDHNDSHAIHGTEPFALLLHGSQPAGTEASAAWQYLKKNKLSGYGKKKQFNLSEIKSIPLSVNFLPSLGKKKSKVNSNE